MTLADVDACGEILLGYPWTHYAMTLERARAALVSGLDQMTTGLSQLHVAQCNENITGFIWWMPRGAFFHSGYIRLIGVAPSAQGHGTGRALIEAAEASVIEASRDMFLLVSDFNANAQAFYRRLGYVQVGALPEYVLPGISELLMRKRLR